MNDQPMRGGDAIVPPLIDMNAIVPPLIDMNGASR